MNKEMNSKRQSKPTFWLRVRIQRGSLMIHLSVQTRWLAAALTALGLLVGSEPLTQLLIAIRRLLH
jgi:hypothetical protein